MRSAILAVAAANVATARFTNTTETPVLPATAGDFKLYGCVTSSTAFPGFKKAATSDFMSIDMCAASCPTKYMGVVGK